MRVESADQARLSRFSALVSAAALFLASASFAPHKQNKFRKSATSASAPATPPTFFEGSPDEGARIFRSRRHVSGYRFADGRPARLPGLARELVDRKVNVIMAVGNKAIVAAKTATHKCSDRHGCLRCGHDRICRKPGASRRQSHGESLLPHHWPDDPTDPPRTR